MNKSIVVNFIVSVSWVFALVMTALFAVHASAQTTADIVFTWGEAECDARCVSVDGYRIYAVGGGMIVDTANTNTEYTATNYALTVGVEQCFTVAAYNSAGEAMSEPVCGILDQSVPSKTTLRVTFPVNS